MQIVEDRRALHRIPELHRELPKTTAYLKNSLKNLNCTLSFPIQGSVCAYFDFGKESTIAFRSDADALPIQEQSGCAFASEHPGKMHACGHDGHMAILLELARRISGKKELPHNVLLIFQPAEETTGGARDICETGILEAHHTVAIFALHLWPGGPAGTMMSRENEMMSHSSELTVDIYGKSAHVAKAWEGHDALAAAVLFYSRVMALEQELPPEVFRLLKFGKMQSGTVRNALSAHTHMEGGLRAFQDSVFDHLHDGILAVAREVEQETGCTAQVHFSEGYPAVMNPKELYQKVRSVVTFEELEKPSMICEDFSWYQKYVPGMFFFLGTGDSPTLHADTFDFDETILTKGADFFEELAEKFL